MLCLSCVLFFFNDTATTEIYTLSLHDALPISTFPGDYTAWTPTQQMVGRVPGLLARGVHQTLGTAGGVLVGLFALSALGILTVGGHPLAGLRAEDVAGGKAGGGGRGEREGGRA